MMMCIYRVSIVCLSCVYLSNDHDDLAGVCIEDEGCVSFVCLSCVYRVSGACIEDEDCALVEGRAMT